VVEKRGVPLELSGRLTHICYA